MSLKMFFDSAGTQAVLTAEKFTGAGPFALTAFTGAQLGGVYKEKKDSYSDIAFAAGVGSGFNGLTPDLLKGQRVVHNNKFVGQVTGNTATTVTISDLGYTAAANSCNISSYVKLYTPTDFTVASSVITPVVALLANETLHAVPIDTLAMYFGGTTGANVTKVSTIYVKRSADFEYTSLQVASDDVSLFPYHTATADVVFAAGIGSGFVGLPVNGLIGKALNHAGAFRGIITSNTETTVTIAGAYTAVAASAEIYNVGSLEFSLDGVTYGPVIALPDLTGAALSAMIYVRDTINIPAVAVNYPSNIVKVSGIEFIA